MSNAFSTSVGGWNEICCLNYSKKQWKLWIFSIICLQTSLLMCFHSFEERWKKHSLTQTIFEKIKGPRNLPLFKVNYLYVLKWAGRGSGIQTWWLNEKLSMYITKKEYAKQEYTICFNSKRADWKCTLSHGL